MKMTKDEAKEQVSAFFEKLGDQTDEIFEKKNFVKAMIGEAILGFVYQDDETLSCQSLIYRFRRKPQDAILNAIEEESSNAPNGGGEIAFDDENFTLVLQKEYLEKTSEDEFYDDMKNLAQASLVWSNEVLSRVAEKAFAV